MKTVEVSAAVIVEDSCIFAARRGRGHLKGGWEFPGGKLEAGETPEAAVLREVKEELDIEITVGELYETVEYDYPEFHLKMYCFLCRIKSGEPVLKEHDASAWFTPETLDTVEWLPANLELIRRLRKMITQKPPV